MKNKKGISPLIATVLIIGFTIVLAAMVMQWGGGLFEKMKTETGISSEVSIACSSKLSELKVTSAKLTGTNLVITIDNSNEQELAGFLFRGYKTDGTVITKEKTNVDDPATTAVDEGDNMNAFEIKPYTLTTTGTGDLPGLDVKNQVGVMAKVTASDGTIHTCSNEKKITITA